MDRKFLTLVGLLSAGTFGATLLAITPDVERVGDEPFYRRCSDAVATGAAPLRRDKPGYRDALDRDGDGIACEPLRQ